MTQLIGIHGKAGAGKDSLAFGLMAHYPTMFKYSFATVMKKMLAVMLDVPFSMVEGIHEDSRKWREEVLPDLRMTPRELMLSLGTEWGRDMVHQDVWVILTAQEVMKINPEYAVFTDVRFTNEAEWILNEGGMVIEVVREDDHIQSATAAAHRSEEGLPPDLISGSISAKFGDLPGLVERGIEFIEECSNAHIE